MKILRGYAAKFLLSFERITKLVLKKSGGEASIPRRPIAPAQSALLDNRSFLRELMVTQFFCESWHLVG
jgi:hypothetical protein